MKDAAKNHNWFLSFPSHLSSVVAMHFGAGGAGRRAGGVGLRRPGGRQAGALPDEAGGGAGEDAAHRGARGHRPGPQALGRAAVPHEGHLGGKGPPLPETEVRIMLNFHVSNLEGDLL